HCIQMDTSVNAANQVVSVGADIAFDADPKFFACLVRFESSSVPTTLPTAYDVYHLDGRHDGGYYTVKDCVTIDVLPRTPGNNVPFWFALILLRFRPPSLLPMMFILCMVAMMVVIIPSRTV